MTRPACTDSCTPHTTPSNPTSTTPCRSSMNTPACGMRCERQTQTGLQNIGGNQICKGKYIQVCIYTPTTHPRPPPLPGAHPIPSTRVLHQPPTIHGPNRLIPVTN